MAGLDKILKDKTVSSVGVTAWCEKGGIQMGSSVNHTAEHSELSQMVNDSNAVYMIPLIQCFISNISTVSHVVTTFCNGLCTVMHFRSKT